jgi:predicted Zn-dependent protease
MWPRPALVLAAALAAASLARAESRTVEVRVGGTPDALEASLPRDGSYGRALDAVRGVQYRRAEELLFEAAAEARRAGASGRIPPSRARLLGAKCEMEIVQVERLRQSQAENDRRSQFEQRVNAAISLHNLYLTSTAWLGRHDGILYERAVLSYQAAMRSATADNIRDERAIGLVLCYASLLARAGHRRSALAELSRIPVEVRWNEDNVLTTAELYASLGDRERALAALAHARDSQPNWPEKRVRLQIANDFDLLRDDPRFVRLVGGEE